MSYIKARSSSLWLSGHSAGSHLCSQLLSSPWFCSLPSPDRRLVCGVVHLSGVFDLKPLLRTSVNTALGMTEMDAVTFSPLTPANVAQVDYNLILT